MESESTTIHWHGISQKGTPYMDGVPFVTQCPILPGNRFKYNFTAKTSGSYLWHAHIGNYFLATAMLNRLKNVRFSD